MPQSAATAPSRRQLVLLSRLLLLPSGFAVPPSPARDELKRQLLGLRYEAFKSLATLAQSNHVIVRGLEAFLDLMREERDAERVQWAQSALVTERARVAVAAHFLHEICSAFQEQRYEVAVIKSLDHWPDLGSDLHVYTNADPADVINLMRRQFGARIARRSWGERLTHQWNFQIPGLPESVAVHIGRWGQTGEQLTFASSLIARSSHALRGGYRYRVPSASDRITISALQWMRRHFHFHLCDVVDTAMLADADVIDYGDLLAAAQAAGIWEGVATYLAIISDYLASFRGAGFEIPSFVAASAQFGGGDILFGNGFLRVPIVPQSARLYQSQLASALEQVEFDNGVRLGLLPCLATAAMLGQKLTASGKPVW